MCQQAGGLNTARVGVLVNRFTDGLLESDAELYIAFKTELFFLAVCPIRLSRAISKPSRHASVEIATTDCHQQHFVVG